jgi:hypothetical protein
VNTENKVGEKNFCKSENDFTNDGSIIVIINLLCAFVQKAVNANSVVVIFIF